MTTTAQYATAPADTPRRPIKDALVKLRRRRTYLIDPKTQFAITRQFVLLLVVASGLSVGNYHVVRSMLDLDRQDTFELVLALTYCGLMLATSATLLFLLCGFFSHRIAGPARKISEALNQLAQGNLCVKVRLRDTDLLTELADAINAASRDLRVTLSEVDGELRRAKTLRGGSVEQLACLQRAEKLLSGFQTTHAQELDARAVASRGARKATGHR